jgi:low affinity Fe/Cu permease
MLNQEDKPQTPSRLRGFIGYFRSPSRAYPLIIFSSYLLLIAYYFLYWVPQHRKELLDQDVRQLAAAGDQIRSKIESLTLIVQTQIDNAERRTSASAEELNRNVPTGFTFETGCPSPGATTNNAMFVVDNTTRGGEAELRWRWPPSKKPSPLKNPPLCARIPLEDLAKPFLDAIPAEHLDDVGVALGTGEVVYALGRMSARVGDVVPLLESSGIVRLTPPPLILQPEGKDNPKPDKPKANVAGGAEGGTSLWREKHEAATRVARNTTSVEAVLGGKKFTVLTQPIGIAVTGLGQDAANDALFRLILIGLIDNDRMRQSARALPPAALVNLTMGIALILIALWPLLKVWQMGPAEGFRSNELLYVTWSLTFSGLLLGSLILFNTRRRDFSTVDARLEAIGRKVDEHLQREVDYAIAAIHEFNRSARFETQASQQAINQAPGQEPDRAPVTTISGLLSEGDPKKTPSKNTRTDFGAVKTDYHPLLARIAHRWYPWLDQIFWVDHQGNQVIKWSVSDYPTQPTKVDKYPLFQNVLAGRTWKLIWPAQSSAQIGGASPEFVIDSMYSPNSGEYFVLVAQERGKGERLAMSAVVSPFISTTAPIMPPEYGFAVLDETGLVRFHSRPAKNLRENFPSETSLSVSIRATLQSHLERLLNADYQGRPHRMLLRPLKAFERTTWSLVVFHDLTLRESFYEVLLRDAVILDILYFVLIAIAIALVAWAWRARNKKDGQPHIPAAKPIHNQRLARILDTWRKLVKQLAGSPLVVFILDTWRKLVKLLAGTPTRTAFLVATVYVSLIVMFIFVVLYHEPLDVLWSVAILFPLIGIFFTWLVLRVGNLAWKLSLKRFQFALVAVATLAITLVSIVPATAFFRISFYHWRVAYIARGQTELAAALQQRADSVRARYRKLRTDPIYRTLQDDVTFLTRRLTQERLDRYEDEWSNAIEHVQTERAAGSKPCEDPVLAVVSPDYNVFPRPCDWKSTQVPGEISWKWRMPTGNRLALGPIKPSTIPWEQVFPIVSTLPPYTPLNGWAMFWVVIVIGALGWVIYELCFRRLGLGPPDLERLPQLDLIDPEDAVMKQNTIALVLPRFKSEERLQTFRRKGCQIHALDDLLSQGKEWRKRTGASGLVVLHGLVTAIEPETRERTYEILVELLHSHNHKLLVLSAVDPVYFLFEQYQDERASVASGKDLEEYSRWTALFSAFKRCCVDESQSMKAFDEEDWHFVWKTCAEREKLALWQLNNDGVVNRKNQFALHHLRERGLVTFNTKKQSFTLPAGLKDFLRSRLPKQQMKAITIHADSAWKSLRRTLLFTAMTFPIVLVVTWSYLWEGWIGQTIPILSAVAVTIPALFKLVQLFFFGKMTSDEDA